MIVIQSSDEGKISIVLFKILFIYYSPYYT
jgi:hypothetical protein